MDSLRMQLNFRNLIMLTISGGVVDLNLEPRAWIVKGPRHEVVDTALSTILRRTNAVIFACVKFQHS